MVPRPVTEELVEWILERAEKDNEASILDVGTGSGIIAISLAASLPSAEITALDTSQDALEVAMKNADKNHVGKPYSLWQSNLLEDLPADQKFTIIAANLPYLDPEWQKSPTTKT